MANWCSTTIEFFGSGYDANIQLKELYEIILEMEKTGRVQGADNLWLGNFVDMFGGDCKEADCRGFITYIEEYENYDEDLCHFRIEQEDAWYPKVGVWREILSNNFPDIEMVYVAEECGCEIYINSDTDGLFFTQKYCAEICDGEYGDYIDSDYFDTQIDLLHYLEMHIPHEDIDEALMGNPNYDAEVYACVHEFHPE